MQLDDRLPADWVRAVLPMMTLAYLQRAPAHGYELLQRLRQGTFSRLGASTLYPLLARQEGAGLLTVRVETVAGPPRKVFSLSQAGSDCLQEQTGTWSTFCTALEVNLTHDALTDDHPARDHRANDHRADDHRAGNHLSNDRHTQEDSA